MFHLSRFKSAILMSICLICLAVLIGSGTAFFLWALDEMTRLRWEHAWLLALLPVAGVITVLIYERFGKGAERGSDLIFEQIHDPDRPFPKRLGPFVLVSTLLTHLCGGSAGREGTAVQMGVSISRSFNEIFRFKNSKARIVLISGLGAGFAAVFGTPFTGVIFAFELLRGSDARYKAILPCLLTSYLAHKVCLFWDIKHSMFPRLFLENGIWWQLGIAAIAFGLTSQLFIHCAALLKKGFSRWIPLAWCRPIIAAFLIWGISAALGTDDYLGLGVISNGGGSSSIMQAFSPSGVAPFAWFWKILLTALTVSAGFKGGEVTPLFFIGATLGAALSPVLGVQPELLAGLGMLAVFAGASNTPLACTVMGVELFGIHALPYYAGACFLASFFSGKASIYASLPASSRTQAEPSPLD